MLKLGRSTTAGIPDANLQIIPYGGVHPLVPQSRRVACRVATRRAAFWEHDTSQELLAGTRPRDAVPTPEERPKMS
jgi:hypothetical protein